MPVTFSLTLDKWYLNLLQKKKNAFVFSEIVMVIITLVSGLRVVQFGL